MSAGEVVISVDLHRRLMECEVLQNGWPSLLEELDQAVTFYPKRDMRVLQEQAHADSQRWFPQVHEMLPTPLTGFFALGIAGEAGEVANKVKKLLRKNGKVTVTDEELADIVEEVADTVIYALVLCEHLGYDLSHAIDVKRRFNEKRFGA